jgi:hypothetical protein
VAGRRIVLRSGIQVESLAQPLGYFPFSHFGFRAARQTKKYAKRQCGKQPAEQEFQRWT